MRGWREYSWPLWRGSGPLRLPERRAYGPGAVRLYSSAEPPLPIRRADMIGRRFGKLLVLERAPIARPLRNVALHLRLWRHPYHARHTPSQWS